MASTQSSYTLALDPQTDMIRSSETMPSLKVAASNDIQLQTRNTTRLTVTSGGSVGIGKIPNTTYALDIQGNLNVTNGGVYINGAYQSGMGIISVNSQDVLTATFSQELALSSADANTRYGNAVAISADGQWAAIGAPGFNGNAGRVVLMRNLNGGWSQDAVLDGLTGNALGTHVALSPTNGPVVVTSVLALNQAQVLYKDTNNITSMLPISTNAGGAVAVSGFVDSGYYIAVYSPVNTRVYIHFLSITSNSLSAVQNFFVTNVSSLAFCADASYLVVGRQASNAAIVIAKTGVGIFGVNTPITLTSPTDSTEEFGASVAISSPETVSSPCYLVVGAPGALTSAGQQAGAVYVFTRASQYAFSFQARLEGGPETVSGNRLGISVAMDSSGSVLAAGAPYGNLGMGTAHLFRRSGTITWTFASTARAPDATMNALFGQSVALSTNAAWVLAGSPQTSTLANNAGSAYLFQGITTPFQYNAVNNTTVLDTAGSSNGTISIGNSNASVIELGVKSNVASTIRIGSGTGGGTITIGATGTQVLIQGTTTFVSQSNVTTSNTTITLNSNGPSNSAINAGIVIQEGGANQAAYLRTRTDRMGWDIKAPGSAGVLSILNTSSNWTLSPSNLTQWSNLGTSDIYRIGGNVGIGTTTPSFPLDVTGATRITGALTVAGDINFTGSLRSNGVVYGGGSGGSGSNSGWTTSNQNAYFSLASNVGIGTTSPAYKLDVAGDINLTGNVLVNGVPYSSRSVTTTINTGTGITSLALSSNAVNYELTQQIAASNALPNDAFSLNALATNGFGDTVAVGKANGIQMFYRSYILTNSPFAIQASYSNEGITGQVAMSMDGNFVAACAPSAGKVYIYNRIANVWNASPVATLIGLGAVNSVSLTAVPDGTNNYYLVVADPTDTGARGKVWTYYGGSTPATWTLASSATLTGAAANYALGTSIAINGTGTTLTAGAPNDVNASSAATGAVYVYTRSGTGASANWGTPVKLVGESAGDLFGQRLVLDYAGTTLTTTMPRNTNVAGTQAGAISVYTTTNAWSSSTSSKLIAPNTNSGDQLGTSLAMSTNGIYLLASTLTGEVSLYGKVNGTWQYITAVSVPTASENSGFGQSLAINNDGALALVGAYLQNTATSKAGTVFVLAQRQTAVRAAVDTVAGSIGKIFPPLPMSANTTDMSGASYGKGTYVASASSETGGSPSYMAFDRINSTFYHIGSETYNSTTGNYNGYVAPTMINGTSYYGEWLQLQIPSFIFLSSYTVIPRPSYAYQAPFSWVIIGSVNGVQWTLLNTQTSITFADQVSQTFNVATSTAYNYYRMIVTHKKVPAADWGVSFSLDYIGIPDPSQIPPIVSVPGNLVVDGSISAGNLGMFRNKLINGDMRIAQRATSFTNISGATAKVYTLDRWCFVQSNTASNSISQLSIVQEGLEGISHAVRIQRPNASTSTDGHFYIQSLESQDSAPLRGQAVTLSFYMRVGATISSTVLAYLVSGRGSDEDPKNITTATWTGQTNVIAAQPIAPLTGSWQRYTYTGIVPWNCNQLCLMFQKNHSGTAGATDYVDITGVQLEKGTIATLFEVRPYAIELQLCRRYLKIIGSTGRTRISVGCAINSTIMDFPFSWDTAFRNTLYSMLILNTQNNTYTSTSVFQIDGHAGGTYNAETTIHLTDPGLYGAYLRLNTSGLTQGLTGTIYTVTYYLMFLDNEL